MAIMRANNVGGTRWAVGDCCSHCGKTIEEYPFIQWDLIKPSDGEYYPAMFHVSCAQKFMLRLSRDLYQLDSEKAKHG